MFRRSYLTLILAAAFIAAASVGVFAQTAPVSGIVELDTNGTKTPVAGALVEVFRIDIKAGFPSTKSSKKGEFNFAGFPFGATYVLSVSAPNCAPAILPNVKAGMEKLLITLTPGDGKKFTEAEVRDALVKGAKNTIGSGPEMSAEDKKKQEEFEAKKKEIDEKNKKIQNADATAAKAFEEGRAALAAKNYDLAIAKFSEGVEAVPDFVGSTPTLLNAKLVAQRGKGFEIYRAGVALTDRAARAEKFAEANKYFDDALVSFQQALDIIAKAPAAADPAEQTRRDTLKSDLYTNATEIHRIKVIGNIDTSKGPDALKLYTELIAMEKDPAKKLADQVTLGDIMRLTGDFEKAVASYREALAAKPDYPEAMAGLGLSLFAQGAAASPEDKEKEQEGLNYMQKYTEIAPVNANDSDSVKALKVSVKEAVDYLKSQKMAPQKTPTKKKP